MYSCQRDPVSLYLTTLIKSLLDVLDLTSPSIYHLVFEHYPLQASGLSSSFNKTATFKIFCAELVKSSKLPLKYNKPLKQSNLNVCI